MFSRSIGLCVSLASVSVLLAPIACSNEPAFTGGGDGQGGTGDGGASSENQGKDTLGGDGLTTNDSVGTSTGTIPGGSDEEICDGIDNDGDGQIDNLDAGGDGICDCLNIGTVGRIGPWSSGGNIFKDWLDTRSPIPAFELGDSTLDDETLTKLDVIVVLRADTAALSQDSSPAHHEFDANEVDALETWVRSGGGLMTTIGYQGDEAAEVVNVNRLLDPFDLGYSTTNLGVSGFLENWIEHPVTEGIERINTNNGVEPLTGAGTILAYDGGDRPAIVAHQATDGRVIVFGDEWVTYDSEWENVEDQQVELLWLNMIKWLSPPKTCQVPLPPIYVK